MNYCLVDFPILTEGKVEKFDGSASICQKFYEMGIRKNVSIQVVNHLPFSQNVHVVVGNESMVLRKKEAFCLKVSRIQC